jgi:hypothetical protein
MFEIIAWILFGIVLLVVLVPLVVGWFVSVDSGCYMIIIEVVDDENI